MTCVLNIGIDNDKWYDSRGNIKAATDISRVNSETSFDVREKVYEKNREELTAQFRFDLKNNNSEILYSHFTGSLRRRSLTHAEDSLMTIDI